ncbi:basic proline-rich protein-like [Colius striatus]|uniref:basic proline-rich protein-like n=1 Tax=Colius striatus TaxID=57412 RepID=UPI002B1E053C|nr:basic proline-rich protein-like [Colius striatus]
MLPQVIDMQMGSGLRGNHTPAGPGRRPGNSSCPARPGNALAASHGGGPCAERGRHGDTPSLPSHTRCRAPRGAERAGPGTPCWLISSDPAADFPTRRPRGRAALRAPSSPSPPPHSPQTPAPPLARPALPRPPAARPHGRTPRAAGAPGPASPTGGLAPPAKRLLSPQPSAFV